MRKSIAGLVLIAAALLILSPMRAWSQVNSQSIYSDELDNGWQDWSWTTHSLTNTSPVYAGTYSISVTFSAWAGLFLHYGDESTSPYTSLQFYLNGGTTGKQVFEVAALGDTNTELGSVPITSYVSGGVVPTNTWVLVTIPLSALNAANVSNFSGIWLQDTTGGSQPTFYVDNISLVGAAVPTTVTATVNTTSVLQTVLTNNIYGVNTAIWDGDFNSSTAVNLLKETPVATLRYPGGSDSDSFDWTKAEYSGMPETKDLGSLTDSLGSVAYITTNYGSGTPQMAAAWAAYCCAPTTSTVEIGVDSTGRDWQTAGYWAQLRASKPLAQDDGLNILRANHKAYGYENYEIGNECFGSWENDTHAKAQDPVIYAQFFQSAQALIKKVAPAAVVGAVVTASEDDYGNQTETVTNPVTGVQHKGWTAVLFSTMKSLGVVPDFVIYHNYPQGPGSESDYNLLHNASNWSGIATSIRTMLTDYFGTAASKTKLVCTENNSVSYNPGKQTTSLVNGLYYADSIGSLLQTEFRTLIWWNLHNAVQTDDNNSSGLYGWRQYGDYGILADGGSEPGAALDTPYPTYMALKLLSNFSKAGDSVLSTTSSYADLTVYASKTSAGVLDLLVINKNPTVSFATTINLTGYTAQSTATEWSYGIPQDTAQENGNSAALSQNSITVSGSSVTQSFAPYSMTVIQLTSAT